MLQYIKQATKNFFNPFGKLEGWNDHEDALTMIEGEVEDGAFLTAAELQYLRKILAEKVNDKEDARKHYLQGAKFFKRADQPELSKLHFKKHRQTKAELKKLVKIQQKLKHSLITMG